jgi:hypothetical protein
MKSLILMFALLAGCAGVPTEAPADGTTTPVPASCEITQEPPSMCRVEAARSHVMRCDAPIENPGGCIGPNGMHGTVSNTWCCL